MKTVSLSTDRFVTKELLLVSVIKGIREKHGYYQKEVAAELNLSPAVYCKFENGNGSFMFQHIIKFCELFDLKLSTIVLKAEELGEFLSKRNIPTVRTIDCVLKDRRMSVNEILVISKP